MFDHSPLLSFTTETTFVNFYLLLRLKSWIKVFVHTFFKWLINLPYLSGVSVFIYSAIAFFNSYVVHLERTKAFRSAQTVFKSGD
jgi:hypothetical protein